MTRRQLLLAASGSVAAVTAGQKLIRHRSQSDVTLRLLARSRTANGDTVQPDVRSLVWKASRTAIIVCDMWDDHYF